MTGPRGSRDARARVALCCALAAVSSCGPLPMPPRGGHEIGLVTYDHDQTGNLTRVWDNAAPTDLVVMEASPSQANLKWLDNASDETAYLIERKTGATGTYAQIASIAADSMSYPDTGLAPETTYYYRVRASNGSGSSSYSNEASITTPDPNAPARPTGLAACAAPADQIILSWTDNARTETGYLIERKPSSSGAYAQIAMVPPDIATYADASVGPVAGTSFYYRVRASGMVASSGYSNEASATATPLGAFAQRAYVKASHPGSGDWFGQSVALSRDGSTLAVGVPQQSSAATGVGGDQTDHTAYGAGAVYVFIRCGTTWSQQAYLKASNTDAGDRFGVRVALSDDGSTLAVGADLEASAAAGIAGDQADNSASHAGAVYVFTRAGTTWSQQAYVKASNPGGGDLFGSAIALSGDGSTLAVGAYEEQSAAGGIGGDQADNSAYRAGAVYVFTRAGTTWSQQAYVKASGGGAELMFGYDVTLSGDGLTLVVGAPWDTGPASGGAFRSGAAHVFTRSGATWSQQASIKASNPDSSDGFGGRVVLSGDGSTLAVGAAGEQSVATGINGNQADNSYWHYGAVYVFVRSGTAWTQQAYVKASNNHPGDLLTPSANPEFGTSVALSRDGATLAVGAIHEESGATGIDGNQADTSTSNAGAVYLFKRSGSAWSQRAYVKASNTATDWIFGQAAALSGEGSTLAVGAPDENSGAAGIDGNQTDTSASDSGAVYVFQ